MESRIFHTIQQNKEPRGFCPVTGRSDLPAVSGATESQNLKLRFGLAGEERKGHGHVMDWLETNIGPNYLPR